MRVALENPRVARANPYRAQIDAYGNFHEKYVTHHGETYHPDVEELVDMSPYFPKGVSELRKEVIAMKRVNDVLEACAPYPKDDVSSCPIDPTYRRSQMRFELDIIDTLDQKLVYVYDRVQVHESYLSWELATWPQFSLGKWYAESCAANHSAEVAWEDAHEWMLTRRWFETTVTEVNSPEPMRSSKKPCCCDHEFVSCRTPESPKPILSLNGIQVDRNKYVSVQRNASRVKGTGERLLPKPITIKALVNGLPVRALVDSGSLGDFMSSTLVDQLKLKRTNLEKPLGLQLAVQGSKSKINSVVNVNYSYQNIKDSRQFDIANLNDYDMILGTPWLYQHQVCIGLNPARIVIGSDVPLPILSGTDTKFLLAAASLSVSDEVLRAREELMAYAEPLCRIVEETELPPLRAINHSIPLIDENKVYPWRPSRCPEVFRSQWNEKRDAYIKSSHWKMTTARNTCPMLLIPKPHKPKNAPELRTVYDVRERNKNTLRVTSPLPDIEGVIRRVAAKEFRSILDLTAAYEQIRIIPEHVERSAMSTLDGNMVSLVLQMGDCNAPATYQTLMNYLFSSYIGRFIRKKGFGPRETWRNPSCSRHL